MPGSIEGSRSSKDLELAFVVIFFISLPVISVSFITVPAFNLPLIVILFLAGFG
jgi:hypothetical protein